MTNISQLIETFNQKEAEILNIEYGIEVLYTDLMSICPELGKEARADQIATLSGIVHEKTTNKEFVDLITSIYEHSEFQNQDEVIIRKIELWRKDIIKNTSLSKEFVQKVQQIKSKTNRLWELARKSLHKKDKQNYLDSLNELYSIKIEEYESIKHHFSFECPYDYFLDSFEENLTCKEIEPIFLEIKTHILEILNTIDIEKLPIEDSKLKTLENWSLTKEQQENILTTMFNHLELKPDFFRHFETTHPFMITLSPNEERVGVAFRDDPLFSFTSGVHEAGHALYEHYQEYNDSILRGGSSMGIHESQSLFWESHISTSKAFTNSFFKEFQKQSNSQLDNISADEFYKYSNRVSKSLIRIEGDELTYPLHIIIRFEIEKDLFNGKITVYDIEKVWNEKYKEYFNTEPQNFKEGFMQDVHWSEALFGYFPTYLLGRVYASQIEKELKNRISNYEEVISNYEFKIILEILAKEILKYGKLKTNKELINGFTKENCNPKTYIEYLKNKYDSIYEN